VADESRLNGWQSGLFSASGIAKPAFNSFRLPIVQAARRGLRTTIWGQVRPGSGRRRYQLQRLAYGRWVAVGLPTLTSPGGFYTRVVWARRGTRFRIAVPDLAATSRSIVTHR
jgi:hypothetical protein